MSNFLHRRLARALVLGTAFAVSVTFGLVLGTPTASAEDANTVAGLPLRFEVELPLAPNGWALRYSYRTEDGTAVAGEDYRSATGKLVFRSNERRKTVSVQTLSNNENEIGSETFKLYLYDLEVRDLYRPLLISRSDRDRADRADRVEGWHQPIGRFRGIPMEMTLWGVIRTGARKMGE